MIGFDGKKECMFSFGSDFPMVDPCEYAGVISGLTNSAPVRWLGKIPQISREFKQEVLGGNAIKLLSMEA